VRFDRMIAAVDAHACGEPGHGLKCREKASSVTYTAYDIQY
jgi:hypothetical protein